MLEEHGGQDQIGCSHVDFRILSLSTSPHATRTTLVDLANVAV
jgi:hypothetical protein